MSVIVLIMWPLLGICAVLIGVLNSSWVYGAANLTFYSDKAEDVQVGIIDLPVYVKPEVLHHELRQEIIYLGQNIVCKQISIILRAKGILIPSGISYLQKPM